VQEKARGIDAGEIAGPAVNEKGFAVVAGVMKGDVEGVFDLGLVAVGAHAGGYGLRLAEDGEGLIDEVRAEIPEHAVGRIARFFPGVFAGCGAVTVEVGLECDEPAEGALGKNLANGEEVAIPAAVVEGNDVEALAVGEIDKVVRLLAGWSEGLVDDDVFAGVEGA